MYKYRFIDSDPAQSPEMVAWANMKMSDKHHNLDLFIVSATGWLNCNPTKNYQDLEKELRDKDLNTHLFAVKPRKIDGTKLGILTNPTKTDFEWECFFSCRPKEYALKEVLQHADTYEQNFERLAKAGIMVVDKKESVLQDPDIRVFKQEQIDDFKLVSDNKKLIEYVKMEPTEFISELKKQITSKFGKEPEEHVLATLDNGAQVYGFILDGQLVSTWGFGAGTTVTGEKEYMIVDLKKLFS